MCAVIYNKATGQNYPHLKSIRQNDRDNSTQISTASSAGLIKSDLTAALRQSKQLIDVDINDLESLFLQTERLAYNRRSVGLQCQQVMTKNIDTLEFSTELNEAWQIIKKRNMQALPVLSRGGHLLGIVTRSDFLREVEIHEFSRFKTQLKNLLKKNNNSTSNKAEVVGQIMRTNIQTALDTSPMIDLAPLMIDQKIRHIAVVNERGLFVGMINQTDMISALYQTTLGLKHH
jgi:CBS domain-containing membrane protein